MTRAFVERPRDMSVADEYHRIDPTHTRRAAFGEEEFKTRVGGVQRAMTAKELDGLLVHTPENIYYLTGYETTGYFEYQVLVVPATGDPQLLIRNVERLNVDEYSWLPGAHIWKDGTDFLESTRALVGSVVPGRRVGIEKHSWFVTAAIADALRDRLTQHELIDAGRLVETIRLAKSPAELVYVRAAAQLADIALEAAIRSAREGATELEVAAAAHDAQIRAGSEYPALPHYVSSGYRTELGHAHWSGRRLATGDLVKLEFLGVKRRYHAGLTRNAVVGVATADVLADTALCIAVQDETFAALLPGIVVDHIVPFAHSILEHA